MSNGPNEFDLSAALTRKAQVDSKAFIEAFAVRLEGALPSQVLVERERDGLFSKTRHVIKVSISLDSRVYALTIDRNRLQAQRSKSVHGVILKSEVLDMTSWLQDLEQDIASLAEYAGSGQQVLHDFLMS